MYTKQKLDVSCLDDTDNTPKRSTSTPALAFLLSFSLSLSLTLSLSLFLSPALSAQTTAEFITETSSKKQLTNHSFFQEKNFCITQMSDSIPHPKLSYDTATSNRPTLINRADLEEKNLLDKLVEKVETMVTKAEKDAGIRTNYTDEDAKETNDLVGPALNIQGSSGSSTILSV